MFNNNENRVKFLSRESFASALRKGQGRALLHVMQYGLDDVADLVLEACVRNQVYDQQVEAGRGDWLFLMFCNSVHLPTYRTAIFNALETETNTRTLMQLSRLTREMAALGDTEARQRLKEFVFRIASGPNKDDWLGIQDWLDLEGANGLLELVRIYGQRLQENPNDFVNDIFLKYRDEPEFKDILKEYSEKEVPIKVYLDYFEEREAQRTSTEQVDWEKRKQDNYDRFREKYSLIGILDDAQKRVGSFPGHYTYFGKHATHEELLTIYTQLLSETDEEVQTRLLWVFRGKPIPQLDQVLFEWAKGSDQELKSASIAALAQVKDERVHHLARSKAETCSLLGGDMGVLELFVMNYESSDAALIARCLVNVHPDPDDAHSLGLSIRELTKRYNDPGLEDAMMWVYENTPCGLCRRGVIEKLHEFGMFTDAMRFECQYDAEDDIREFANNVSKLQLQ